MKAPYKITPRTGTAQRRRQKEEQQRAQDPPPPRDRFHPSRHGVPANFRFRRPTHTGDCKGVQGNIQ